MVGSGKARPSVLRRVVLGEVLVVVGVVERAVGIAGRQALGPALAVDDVVRARDHVEVAHLVDQGAALGVGAGQRRAPERTADEDLVRPGRVDVGVVVLVAAAVDGDLPAVLVHRRVDRLEVVERGRVALRAVGAEPGGVARADRAAGQVVLRVLAVGAGLDHRVHRGRRLGRGAAGEGDFAAATTTAAATV